jgi:hypothetical protein
MPSTIGIVAGGVWTPLELSPDLWLDAADTTTITASSGSVSQWNDKSGNGRNFTQGTGGNQPTTGTRTQNGLNVLDFDGTDDFLEGGDILDILTNSATIVVVTKLDVAPTTGTRGIVGKSRALGATGRYSILWELPTGGHLALFHDTAARLAVSDPGSTNRTNVFVLGNRIIRASTMTLWRNGNVVATNSNLSGTTSYNTTDVWLIGAYQNGAGTGPLANSYMDGFVAEVLVFMRALSDNEMGQVNEYLRSKWAVY